MITVVIIDDDPFVTKSLQTILESTKEIRVLGIGHCAKDALVLYETHRPDVLLTDLRMPKQTGIDAAKEILAKFPKAILLLLTTFKDEEYIREAFSIGVKGYLIKQNLQAIIPSVKSAYNGQAVFGNESELAIIKEVAAGKNNKEIADALYLSDGTVRNYISQLLEKLDLRDRTQLAIYFYQHLQ